MINSDSMGKLVIGIEVAPDHAFGRAFAEGVSKFAIEQKNWKLRPLRQDNLNVETLGRCDGAILRVLNDRVERIARETGVALVDISCERPRPGIAQITTDEAAAGRLAAEFLLFRGFTHFGTCGVNNFAYSDNCTNAFCQRIGKSGFSVSHYKCPARFRGKDILDNGTPYRTPDATDIRRWLRSLPKPAAVFCCNDLRAVQVLKVCADCGLNVPEDLAVLGADNDVLLCTFASPSLSSIETDPFAQGRTAAEMLDRQMQGKPSRRKASAGVASVLHRPKRVVERSSTDTYPFRIPWLVDAVRYIRRNVADGVTADDVVRMVGYSHPKVNQAFTQELGHSIKKEILHQRIRLACAMLRNTDLPSSAVAVRCGYRSPQYFSHCFIGEFGMTPELWRKDGAFQESQSDFQ